MSANIVVRCQACRRFAPPDRPKCQCGATIRNLKLKDWWLDLTGKENPRPGTARTRKRIGKSENAVAAQAAMRTMVTAVTEGRYIERDQSSKLTLAVLINWYRERPETRKLRSYEIVKIQLANILKGMGPTKTIAGLSEGDVSDYRALREAAGMAPSTVNKEVGQLVAAINAAIRAKGRGIALVRVNPIEGIKKLDEDNVRGFVIGVADLDRLVKACPDWLAPIVECAYYLPMRLSEFLTLQWDQVDFERGFLRLRGKDTKNKTGRVVPLHPRASAALKRILPKWPAGPVFNHPNGLPISHPIVGHSMRATVDAIGLIHPEFGRFRFHDLRHCAGNNLRLAGNDEQTIMKIGGWKTRKMFERYSLVSQEEVLGVRWLDTRGDTKPPAKTGKSLRKLDK